MVASWGRHEPGECGYRHFRDRLFFTHASVNNNSQSSRSHSITSPHFSPQSFHWILSFVASALTQIRHDLCPPETNIRVGWSPFFNFASAILLCPATPLFFPSKPTLPAISSIPSCLHQSRSFLNRITHPTMAHDTHPTTTKVLYRVNLTA